jgi:predicted aspartyl protease
MQGDVFMYKNLLIPALFVLFSYSMEAEVLVEIPFTINDEGRMLTFGTINGVTGFYLIDTGATDILMLSPVSNLEAIRDSPFEFWLLGETFTTMRYKIDTIYLGNMAINGGFSVIKPPEHLKEFMPKEICGIINPCVFGAVYVEFSFSEKKIKLHDSLPENYAKNIPYTYEFPKPFIKIETNGASYDFQMDTGATVAIGFPEKALDGVDAKNKIKIAISDKDVAADYTECHLFKSGGFSLFDHAYNNVICETNTLYQKEEVGVIGLELLRRYDFVFDPFENKLYYRPLLPESFYNLFFNNKSKASGLIQLDYTEGGLTVKRIIVGSPAWKAGLRPGHIITKINSYDAEGISKDYLIRTIQSNDSVKIEYKDGDRRRAVRIRSKLLIK